MSGSRELAWQAWMTRLFPADSLVARIRDRLFRARRAASVSASGGELLEALNDVASAVSSTLSVEEVLDTVVDRAKLLSGTDKTVLMLTSDHSEGLDPDTLTVRGRRDTHAESWWLERVRALAPGVLNAGVPQIEQVEERGAWLVCAPIRIRDRAIGVLCAINDRQSPFTGPQVEALRIVSSFAAAAIENARLAEEHRYVLLASERDRIAREMHDGISQSLFSISIGLEVCRKQVHRDPATVSTRLDELQEELGASMVELRRVIYDLRPARLTEQGLPASIGQWIGEVTAGRGIRGNLVVRGDAKLLSGATEACLYRVAKEAVSNVVRHSQAASFEVCLDYRSESVVLLVADDGHGFDVDAARTAAVSEGSDSLGLHSIGHRVRAEGGSVTVRSVLGEGTQVRVEIPV